jgi:hypothetical protein
MFAGEERDDLEAGDRGRGGIGGVRKVVMISRRRSSSLRDGRRG